MRRANSEYVCMYVWIPRACMYACLKPTSVYVCMFEATKRVCLKASSVYVWSPQACMNVCLISQKSLGFKNPLENALLEHSCSLFWSCVRGGTLEKPSSMYVCMYVWIAQACMYACMFEFLDRVCMFEFLDRVCMYVCLKASSVYVWACMFERVCMYASNIHT